jgi:hypothetical protein
LCSPPDCVYSLDFTHSLDFAHSLDLLCLFCLFCLLCLCFNKMLTWFPCFYSAASAVSAVSAASAALWRQRALSPQLSLLRQLHYDVRELQLSDVALCSNTSAAKQR